MRAPVSQAPLIEIESNLSRLFSTHERCQVNQCIPSQGQDSPEVITEDEVDKAIKRLKRRKAAGVDGITNEHIVYGLKSVKPVILKLFNSIITSGYAPKQWSVALVTPVYKRGARKTLRTTGQ